MRLGWLRASLVVLLIGVALAAGYWAALLDGRIAEGRAGEREFTESAWRAALSLSELRCAQQAYIESSDRDAWAAQAAARTDATLNGLAELARLATAAGAARAVEDASAAVGDLLGVGATVREHVAEGQSDLAWALLLADGGEFGGEAAGHVQRALALEGAERDAAIEQLAATRAAAFLAAVGSGVLAALGLLLVGRGQAGRSDEEAEDSAAEEPEDGAEAAERNPLDVTLDADTAPPGSAIRASAEAAARAAGAAALDLPAAAVVCTDLGRLGNASELPEVLGRAASVLNASGMIVWVSDGASGTLRAAIGHGYSSATLSRLGAIPHDSENATAAAFREARLHVVPAGASGAGAIVAPLVSSVDCFGVLSAELREGWEARPDVQALTRIVAAQLATLVAPEAPAHAERAERRRAQA